MRQTLGALGIQFCETIGHMPRTESSHHAPGCLDGLELGPGGVLECPGEFLGVIRATGGIVDASDM